MLVFFPCGRLLNSDIYEPTNGIYLIVSILGVLLMLRPLKPVTDIICIKACDEIIHFVVQVVFSLEQPTNNATSNNAQKNRFIGLFLLGFSPDVISTYFTSKTVPHFGQINLFVSWEAKKSPTSQPIAAAMRPRRIVMLTTA